jgi:hypothetical protein
MGDLVDSGKGLSYRSASLQYVAWRVGTTTLCGSRLYPRSQRLLIWLRDRNPKTEVNSGPILSPWLGDEADYGDGLLMHIPKFVTFTWGWNLNNKLRFTWGWAEVLSMDHIVHILNLVAWLDVFSLSLQYVCIEERCLGSTSWVSGPQVKNTYTEWLKTSLLSFVLVFHT